jgi:hypothetical protein
MTRELNVALNTRVHSQPNYIQHHHSEGRPYFTSKMIVKDIMRIELILWVGNNHLRKQQ